MLNDAPARMENTFANGAAYIDGVYMPIERASIPITDWGYRRSDVTYDVVGVWDGNFFRLDDHIRRFRKSMNELRLHPSENDHDIKTILTKCVALSGLRNAYVAMDCLRGRPKPGQRFHPALCRNYIAIFAIPWVSVIAPEVQERGAHIIIASNPRISDRAVPPTVKNFHWGDLTRGLFEAEDLGADNCILLDDHGFVTEGAGFNVFAVIDGSIITPNRGVLEGITRESVKELCQEMSIGYQCAPLHADTLLQANEVFLSTTAGGIMPVSRINGRILSDDKPGPISTKLKNAFWHKRANGWHATAIPYSSAS